MARTIAFAFLCAAAILLILAGCTQGPTGNATVQPSGSASPEKPSAGRFPAFEVSGKNNISINLDTNSISFKFRVDTNDMETLASACYVSCASLRFEKYSLQFNTKKNIYSCLCSTEVCKDSEYNGQILRNCNDNTRAFYFKAA